VFRVGIRRRQLRRRRAVIEHDRRNVAGRLDILHPRVQHVLVVVDDAVQLLADRVYHFCRVLLDPLTRFLVDEVAVFR
jgi:hypothetical protein